MCMRLTGALVFYRHGEGVITTLRAVQAIKKAAGGKKLICLPSILLLVQDFQQSHVI